TQLTKDIMFMITSRVVLENVIENLKTDMTPKELAESINVQNPEGTRILEISIVNKDPYFAKELADTVAKVASQNLVNIMEIEKINILEDGNLPIYPSSPNISKNTVIGAVSGCAIACFIILAFHLMNDRIKTADDIEKYLGITTLGVIPFDDEEKKKKSVSSKTLYQQEEYAS
ncbi:MAG TPA: hypothetical protein PK304_06400, partial [Mobilitalea sp.]|nr:hypothetical protein [Mobilitalea sp.]